MSGCAKNDSGSSGDVAASDSRFSITASHGGTAGNVIGTVNFVLPLVANDYIELMWATSNAAGLHPCRGCANQSLLSSGNSWHHLHSGPRWLQHDNAPRVDSGCCRHCAGWAPLA
jgi:hypothetical protein